MSKKRGVENGVPAGALSNVFSVSSTKKVYFSKGNLQATYDGSKWTWAFAANQWDIIGDATSNNCVTGNATVTTPGTVDLFGYSTSATYYGINYCTSAAISEWNDNQFLGDFVDWGTLIGTGWRTLTGGDSGEWAYLFNTRTTDSGVRFARATVHGIGGVILLPDDWNTSYHALQNANMGDTEYSANNINSTDWTNDFEAHGAVFLPAAGFRRHDDREDLGEIQVGMVGIEGFYWTSTPKGDTEACFVAFYANATNPADGWHRCTGNSVRLVYDVQ
jgi:hypothetical protein